LPLFALDHNYPRPIIAAAAPSLEDSGIEFTYVDAIDERLAEFDDWELLLALHHHSEPWDGLISNDANMLTQPRELVVLGFTRLTLVAPEAVGHDPVRSTGFLLAHIQQDIAARTTTRRPQVWKLSRRTPRGEHPQRWIEKEAAKLGLDPIDLSREAMPGREILDTDPLATDGHVGQ
jgi:hypothetical protein